MLGIQDRTNRVHILHNYFLSRMSLYPKKLCGRKKISITGQNFSKFLYLLGCAKKKLWTRENFFLANDIVVSKFLSVFHAQKIVGHGKIFLYQTKLFFVSMWL